jgi:hypothetical protein
VRVRKSISDRSPLLDAAFHSPAARANLATGSRNRVNAPGLHLRSDPGAYAPTRSVSNSRPAQPFSWLARYDQCLKPVVWVKLRDFPPVFEPPLPSRTFLSFGIKALGPTPFGNACFYESPDLPSLPVSRKLLIIAARRIIAPDPLLPVKLAVPRTSWNHLHDAPGPRRRQYENYVSNREHLIWKQRLTRVSLWTMCV